MKNEFMRKAAELALLGRGRTKTNPCVGAVIVKDGEIIANGWHDKFGGAHAERNALRFAAGKAWGSDLYVTLEPCSTRGKTLPCTDLIIRSRIKKVYIGVLDPNPINHGKGIKALNEAGIETEVGVEAELCGEVIADFYKYIKTRTPYVTLKIAQSLDGKIASGTGESQWITSENSRIEVSALRSKSDAVLVGINTALADNPRLTPHKIKTLFTPTRVILDSFARLPLDSNPADVSQAPTLLYVGTNADNERVSRLNDKGVQTVRVSETDGRLNLHEVLEDLGSRGIMNLLAEGGAEIYTSFLEQKLADKVIIYIAPILLGGSNSAVRGFERLRLANAPKLTDITITQISGDIRIEGKLLLSPKE
jgi:diaminohydroxyphosphoribosylaminopyrimidine deaminase/5-amino-6-(5-phosphoribosylamino)uracil reductase